VAVNAGLFDPIDPDLVAEAEKKYSACGYRAVA
jgi:hypothetical protein